MSAARLLRPLAALGLAAALVALVLALLGTSPRIVAAALAEGAFGNWLATVDTLVKATPLVFCGLAVALPFAGSLWNIGADGQLIAGALAAGALGPALTGWPPPLALAALLGVGTAGGGLWGALAGWLRARRDVSEVISTIMLNFIALQLLSWAVHGPLIEPSRAYPQSAPIAPAAALTLYLPPSRLHAGMLLAVLLAAGCYILLFHTAAGFELRAMGRNRPAALYAGIPVAWLTVWTMAVGGGLAGLGGAVQVAAITHRLYEKMSPGWGFEAIAVALVARLNPLAIVPAAVLFGALDNGAQAMQRSAGISPVLVQVVEALVIMLLLAADSGAMRRITAALAADRHERRVAPAPAAGSDA